jgi:hypothetical protein
VSGPWDRPPNRDAEEAWPSEDVQRAPSDPPSDRWSTDDPWSDRPTDSSSGWAEWPSSIEPPDELVAEEPEPPVSDPWAESWTEDELVPLGPQPDEARAAQEARIAEEPRAPQEPLAQPWMPDRDPWEQLVAHETEGVRDAGAVREAEGGFDAGFGANVRPETVEAPTGFEAPSGDGAPTGFEAPTGLEPLAESGAQADLEAELAREDEVAREILRESMPPAPSGWASEPVPDWLAEPAKPAEPEAPEAPRTEPVVARIEPVVAGWEPDLSGPWGEILDEPAPGLQTEAESELEPELESRIAVEPEPAWFGAPARDVEREPELEALPEPEALPATDSEPAATMEAEAAPEVIAAPAPQLEPEPDWESEAAWRDRPDSTQVFPTSWTPPEPIAPERPLTLEPDAGPIRLSVRDEASLDMGEPEEEELPSTAEQAVPWLIGVILLLAGMVIVLLALIFAGDASLASSGTIPSGGALAELTYGSGLINPTASPTPIPTSRATPTPTPTPPPEYGALEMIYQGRSAAREPIYLLRRNFQTAAEPEVLARDPVLDVRSFAWAPDGTVGAGLLADVLVSIEPGIAKRPLADGISALTFGDDTSTVYAVRVTQDGDNDIATVLAIDFASGDTTELAAPSYARPDITPEEAVAEAQFIDEGGAVRLHWLETDQLRLWVLGGGVWDISPSSGRLTEREGLAVLWGPDGVQRVSVELVDGVTTLGLIDVAQGQLATATVEGRVSHVRWSGSGEQIVFTVGTAGPQDGVLQDLYLWNLNEEPPMRMTATGAAFGAEWRGTQPRWHE